MVVYLPGHELQCVLLKGLDLVETGRDDLLQLLEAVRLERHPGQTLQHNIQSIINNQFCVHVTHQQYNTSQVCQTRNGTFQNKSTEAQGITSQLLSAAVSDCGFIPFVSGPKGKLCQQEAETSGKTKTHASRPSFSFFIVSNHLNSSSFK